jgi:DNA-directed RNA polymerase specialized sigma24 family protein
VHLDADLREAFKLYYLTEPGLTYRQIAAVQGVGVATAYDRVQKALALLIDAVTEDSDE